MPKTQRIFKQGDSVQRPGSQEQIENQQRISEQEALAEMAMGGGSIIGKEGGLRVDMFTHDDPDDLPCICDLPIGAQEIIYDEIEYNDSQNAEADI